MITVTAISRYLFVCSLTLMISGVIDIWLWLTYGYHVPSWSIGVMSLAIGIVILLLCSRLADIIMTAQELAHKLEERLDIHATENQEVQQTDQH